MTEQTNDTPADLSGVNRRATGKNRADQIAAIVLLLFSGYVIADSLKMPLMSTYGPGPGLFPLVLGIILAVLALGLLFEASSPKTVDGPSPFPDRQKLFAAGLVMIALAGYALLIVKLGYVLTTFLFVLFIMGVVQRDNFKTMVFTAVGISLLLYLIFDVGLGVHLPKGPFGF